MFVSKVVWKQFKVDLANVGNAGCVVEKSRSISDQPAVFLLKSLAFNLVYAMQALLLMLLIQVPPCLALPVTMGI